MLSSTLGATPFENPAQVVEALYDAIRTGNAQEICVRISPEMRNRV